MLLNKSGYALLMPGNHPSATVNLPNASMTTDVSCLDGSSYTLSIPLSPETYSISASSNNSPFPFQLPIPPFLSPDWVPSSNQNSPSVYQGSATAPSGCRLGIANKAYFRAVGVQDTHAGDPAGPGILSTDTTDPLDVRFHCSDGNHGPGGFWSPAVTVNFNPPN